MDAKQSFPNEEPLRSYQDSTLEVKFDTVRAQITLKNGQVITMGFFMPVITKWSEPIEKAAHHVKKLIQELNGDWLSADSFFIEVGYTVNGEFRKSFQYRRQQFD